MKKQKKEISSKKSKYERIKSLDHYRRSFVKQALRKASLKWPARYEAIKRARKKPGKLECALCKKLVNEKKTSKKDGSLYTLDHLSPVTELETNFRKKGYKPDWNEYIERLLVDVDGWRILCKKCDIVHTELQNKMREYYIK